MEMYNHPMLDQLAAAQVLNQVLELWFQTTDLQDVFPFQEIHDALSKLDK